MENDILYDCAAAYRRLENHQFEFQIRGKSSIETIKLLFTDEQFKHLSGITYLKDLVAINNLNSSRLLNKVLHKEITFKELEKSKYIDLPLNHNSEKNVEYFLKDRLKTLTGLYDFLHNSKDNLRINFWDNSSLPTADRPHFSNICADFLFTFREQPISRSDTERVCSFFLQSSSENTFSGVSIFPTDLDYSDDGKRSVPQYQILSITEIEMDSNNKVANKTVLYSVSQTEFEKTKEIKDQKALRNAVKKDVRKLKGLRSEYIQNPNSSSSLEKYNKFLEQFVSTQKFSDSFLAAMLTSLESQLADPHNEPYRSYIQKEADSIRECISNRQTETDISQEQATTSQEDLPTVTEQVSSPTSVSGSNKPQQITPMNGGAAAINAYNPFDVLAASIKNFFSKIYSAYNALADLAVSGLDKLVGVKDDAEKPKIEHTDVSNKKTSNPLIKKEKPQNEQISQHLEEIKKRQPTKGKVADEIARLQKEIKEKEPSDKEKSRNKDVSL